MNESRCSNCTCRADAACERSEEGLYAQLDALSE